MKVCSVALYDGKCCPTTKTTEQKLHMMEMKMLHKNLVNQVGLNKEYINKTTTGNYSCYYENAGTQTTLVWTRTVCKPEMSRVAFFRL